jgi:hypothetical protein
MGGMSGGPWNKEHSHLPLDPLLSLALSLHTHKGVYALLVGSGLSKAASIPTGWEVTSDLIRKVATLKNEVAAADPAGWFERHFGTPPTYPELLQLLAPTPAERQSLLRTYFEPSKDDREQGRKLPTNAHRIIAQLVVRGYVRVVVTTNFDRLIEQALEHAGVHPTVVSSPDDAAGMVPLVHAPCVVVKVHGDYLDTRIRNAPEEVASYDAATDELLDRIFSEFGLVVCGWSADWDTALRAAIVRNTRFRFSTFWMARGEPSEVAQSVAAKRQAIILPIASADAAFADIEGKLAALESMRMVDPLTPRLASEEVKRLILSANSIRLHDLALMEADRIRTHCNRERFPVGTQPTAETFKLRVEQVEAVCWPLVAMAVTGAYWGKGEDEELWVRCVEHLAKERQEPGPRHEWWTALEAYPATLVTYAAGMSAIASHRWSLVRRLLESSKSATQGVACPLAYRTAATLTLRYDPAQWLVTDGGDRKFKTPGSDWLVRRLRPVIVDVTGPDTDSELLFDQFEIVSALAAESMGFGDTYGRFAWRGSHPGYPNPLADFAHEVERLNIDHPLLRAGMFDGDIVKLNAALRSVQRLASKIAW